MKLFFTKEKLQLRTKELEAYRYLNRKKIPNLKFTEDLTKEEKYPREIDSSWEELNPGKSWEGRDKYFWIKSNVEVPKKNDGNSFVLLFDFGKSNPGNTAGFEAQFFVNDKLYQGVDGNHKEVFIDESYNGETIEIALKLWGGLEGGGPEKEIYHQFKYADQANLSTYTDNLYYNAIIFLETIDVLDENDPIRYTLLDTLNEAFKLINWSRPGSQLFYESVKEADTFINDKIDDFEKNEDVTVTAIGHTHIDVAWLWRLKHTREKSARSFSTVLRLMEQYPEYIFLQTQPQVYEYIKKDYPELYEGIRKRIEEGRWEIDGAMWLESDTNIPSGESLVRQILFGKRFIKDEFDQDIHYLWLPDVFGYSWALPQILKKSGIDMFMTTKISWNQFNRMPNDTFLWRGMDGSEVLTHFITTPDPNSQIGPYYYTYNGLLEPYTVKGIYDGYQNKNLNNNLLLAYGYGDGGGGVNRDMLEKGRRMKDLPGLPNLKTGKAKDYFKELKETIDSTNQYVHTWDGELYFELHRGTYTSQARNKNWNRRLELQYRDIEFLSYWLSKSQKLTYPKEILDMGWKIILRNQFHDTIPGTSIKEVYEDSEIEYSKAENLALDVAKNIQDNFDKSPNKWTIVNTAGWRRNELVFISNDAADGHFIDSSGNKLKSTKVNNGYQVLINDVPALGTKELEFINETESRSKELPFTINDDGIQTPYYEINWNDKGQLNRIYDLEANREVLAEDGLGNKLQVFEDKPMAWDAWDIDIFYQEKMIELEPESFSVKEENELYAVMEFEYTFGESSIYQEMFVYSDTKRIDFKTKVDWKERQQLLKTAFEVDIRATEATYDIQYGNVKRPTHWNTSWDMAKFETVGHQWANLSETDYGVSLLNNNKYGYDIKDNVIRLSLLKGPIFPDPGGDVGEHEFVYSLLPHDGRLVDSDTVKEAWEINSPLVAMDGTLELSDQFIELESDYPIMIDAIKKAENKDGLVLRLHDYTGGKQTIKLTPQFEFNEWVETNLMEEPISDFTNTTEEIKLTMKPYEIKTIYIE
jgi:alpha-mannosidase